MVTVGELPKIISELYHEGKIKSVEYDIHGDYVTIKTEFTIHRDVWHGKTEDDLLRLEVKRLEKRIDDLERHRHRYVRDICPTHTGGPEYV